MLNKMTAKLSPKAVRNIKIGAAVVGAALAAVAVGVVLYKTGLIENVIDPVEEALEAAATSA